MHDTALAHAIVETLAVEIGEQPAPPFDPLPCDSWIARSVMQKCIRRGMLEFALRAAAQLALIDRRTLWRRLLITALEDLGPKHLETTAKIVFGWSARGRLSPRSGAWPLVAELIRQCCAGSQAQVANDLWNIGQHHPSVAHVRRRLCGAAGRDYLNLYEEQEGNLFGRAAVVIAGSEAVICGRGLGAEDLCGWSASSQSELARITYTEAFRLTRVPLAPLLLLVAPTEAVQSVARSDVLPVSWNGLIPTFAIDQYTRAGKASLSDFSRVSEPWQVFVRQQGLSNAQGASALAELVFRLDGAALTGRDQQESWLNLRAVSMVLGSGIKPTFVHEGLGILRAQLPAIDRMRSKVQLTH